MIFLRFSTEFSPSTGTEKLPPVVVVTFSVMAVADDGPELVLEPHPMAGTVEVCGVAAAAAVVDDDDDDDDEEACGVDEGPPSRESPPPDLSIVLLSMY